MIKDYSKYIRFLIKEGYFKHSYDNHYEYDILTPTDKFKAVFDTCIKKCIVVKDGIIYHKIITPELFMKVLKSNNAKREIRSSYRKVKRPEGYMTVKERQEKIRKDREARELRHVTINRKPK